MRTVGRCTMGRTFRMKDEIKTKLEDITQRQLMIMNDVYAICRHVDHNPDDMTE